jgi:hypothetical protein
MNYSIFVIDNFKKEAKHQHTPKRLRQYKLLP